MEISNLIINTLFIDAEHAQYWFEVAMGESEAAEGSGKIPAVNLFTIRQSMTDLFDTINFIKTTYSVERKAE